MSLNQPAQGPGVYSVCQRSHVGASEDETLTGELLLLANFEFHP